MTCVLPKALLVIQVTSHHQQVHSQHIKEIETWQISYLDQAYQLVLESV
jgi:hypothetical protein